MGLNLEPFTDGEVKKWKNGILQCVSSGLAFHVYF